MTEWIISSSMLILIVLDLMANHWKVSVEEARRILEMETAS